MTTNNLQMSNPNDWVTAIIIIIVAIVLLVLWGGCNTEKYYPVKEIVITIDDAPAFPENTIKLLDILQKHNVQATFFCIGEYLKMYPEIANRIASEQCMSNHTWNHIDIGNSNIDSIYVNQIAANRILIDSINAANNKPLNDYFRPPYGSITTSQVDFLKEIGYDVIMWDLSAEDWDTTITANEIVEYHLREFSSHAEIPILLFHLSDNSVIALDKLIVRFKEIGLKVISLQERELKLKK